MPKSRQPTLVRAIGRWSLAALTINCIIGSGVFGLPSVIARTLGNASPFAWLFAAAGTALVMACFAEVSSHFDQTGGVYLYSRSAFGRSAGIAIAWLGLLARLTAVAVNANLFVIYLAQFWPAAIQPVQRAALLTLLMAVLTWVNYIGVRSGTVLSNLFTVAKLATLGALVTGGLLFLVLKPNPLLISAPAGPAGKWLHAILLLMFAYGGYETALVPGGEARNPRRDYPFALFVALLTCTFLFTMTQWIVISVVPPSAMTDRPVATAAQVMLGPWGAGIVSIAVMIACYGYLSANMLSFPRMAFALAEQRDVPYVFARIHPKFRTPHVAIVTLAICIWVFSLAGGFQWNLMISSISRLIYYGSVCAALPVLRRRKDVPQAKFSLPLGEVFSVLAVGVSLMLFPKLDHRGLVVVGILALCITLNIIWAARRDKGVSAAA